MKIGDLVNVRDMSTGIDCLGMIIDSYDDNDGMLFFDVAYEGSCGWTPAWFPDLQLKIISKAP